MHTHWLQHTRWL